MTSYSQKANPNASNSEMDPRYKVIIKHPITSNINDRLDFMSEVLRDFCIKHDLEFLSAGDLLNHPYDLTEYQIDWLTGYIETWDILQDVESEEQVSEVEKCIVDTNGEYAECVDHLLESLSEGKE